MATVSQWASAARPRTFPAAFAPVLAGTGAAAAEGGLHVTRAMLAGLLALLLQIGVNYANDYSDGIRGTDDDRVGPFRLTGSRAARAHLVKRAAFVCFGLGSVAGLALIVLSGKWWLIALGVAAIAAAWYYTGGKKPYGYQGWGEVVVFIFFGLVAVMGTTYTQLGSISGTSALAAVAIGLLAVAILLANNLRDIPTDTKTGKKTLAVRMGEADTRVIYTASVGVPFLLAMTISIQHFWALLTLLAVPLAIKPVRSVVSGAKGADLVPVLKQTGVLELIFSGLLCVGLFLG